MRNSILMKIFISSGNSKWWNWFQNGENSGQKQNQMVKKHSYQDRFETSSHSAHCCIFLIITYLSIYIAIYLDLLRKLELLDRNIKSDLKQGCGLAQFWPRQRSEAGPGVENLPTGRPLVVGNLPSSRKYLS